MIESSHFPLFLKLKSPLITISEEPIKLDHLKRLERFHFKEELNSEVTGRLEEFRVPLICLSKSLFNESPRIVIRNDIERTERIAGSIYPVTEMLQLSFRPLAKKTCTHRKKYRTVKQVTIHDSLSCLLYTSPSPRDQRGSRMPSSA